MPVPPAIARQATMLAALLGCALVVGPARDANATGCHVPDRPIFGLSTSPDVSTLPALDPTIAEAPEPIRIDRHCPADAPERPSSRTIVSGELTIAEAVEADPRAPLGVLVRDRRTARPQPSLARIERPPRER